MMGESGTSLSTPCSIQPVSFTGDPTTPGPLHPVNKKVIIPSVKESEINSRARSAKLSIADKV